MRFSQTAEQKTRSQQQYGYANAIFSYTKYDNEARVVEAGEYKSNDICYWSYKDDCPTIYSCICQIGTFGVDSKVNDVNWPNNSSNTYEETYIAYDTPSLVTCPTSSVPCNYTQTYLPGRVTKTWNSEGATHYSYDAHGRVKFAVQEINALSGAPTPSGGAGGAFKTIDYVYTTLTSRVDQIIYQKGNLQEEFRQKYTYDSDYRLSKTEVSRDGGTTWLAASEYDYYTHGPLKKTSLGNKIQDIDLTYNINGWLKAINNPISSGTYANESGEGGTTTTNFAKDVFGEAINYFKGDYKRTSVGLDENSSTVPGASSNIVVNNKAKDLFNGNISSVVSYTAFELAGMTTTPNTMTQAYRYDVLNRLTDLYTETSDATTFAYATTDNVNDPYGVHLTYDANGNIKSLIRNTLNRTFTKQGGGTATGTEMDNMTYNYPATTTDPKGVIKKTNNRLGHVVDAALKEAGLGDIASQSTGNYTYDAKGRITSDVSSNISSIDWTVYDKVKKITKSNGTIVEFTYNSKQQRQTKKVDPTGANNEVTTIYSYDASGILMATYEQSYNTGSSAWEYKLNEEEIYGLSRVGSYAVNEVLTASATTASNTAANLRFEISDHLGSVRAVVTGEKKKDQQGNYTNDLNIVSLTDYTDFGMSMQGRSFVSENYRYGYQGSEKDNETFTGAYTTEFRMLDVRLGRWFTPDPITHPWSSPYNSMDNNPIAIVDPLGLEGEDPCGGGAPPATSSMDFGTSIDVPGAGSGAAASPGSGGGDGGSGGSPASAFNFGGGIGFDVTSFAGQATRAAMPTFRPAATAAGNPISVSNTAANNPSKLGTKIQNVNLDNKYEPLSWAAIWATMQPGWSVRINPPVADKPGVNIATVLPKDDFKGQGGNNSECFNTCVKILRDAKKLEPDGSIRDNVLSDGDPEEENILIPAEKVVEIITKELKENKPVIVGVNTKKGGPNMKYGTTADHYIIIVGKEVNNGIVSFLFYDVGTDKKDKGTSKKNKLTLKDGRFVGTSEYRSTTTYTLSQIRHSKK